nr:hypothetical protein CFP56_15376 [Quercus suber]
MLEELKDFGHGGRSVLQPWRIEIRFSCRLELLESENFGFARHNKYTLEALHPTILKSWNSYKHNKINVHIKSELALFLYSN